MTPTISYMERPAAMPMAAPMGAVGFGHRSAGCSMYSSAQHRAANAHATANAVKPWAFWIGRQMGLTTDRSARHLGRSST